MDVFGFVWVDNMATDDADVPDSGAVFTFGKSKFADNLPDKFWIRNDKVLQVSCGDEHTALVAESGRVFTFGLNDWGQLGLGHTKTVTKPSCIKSLKKERVKVVACGRTTTLLATESGTVYSFGANVEGQLGVEGLGEKSEIPVKIKDLPKTEYKMLSSGVDHCMALTQEGDVYTWGGGSEGQLGLGPDMMDTATPIKLPMNESVSCISCGYYHSAFITESGKLFTCGETDGGKLGHGDHTEDSSIPQEATGIRGKATWVACGGGYTVVITDSGKVYTFGDGSSGQIGLGTLNLQVNRPVQLATLAGHKIRYASCGDNHTALVSDKGVLLTFGDGRHGKLGLGVENFANQFIPSQVSRFGNFFAEKVSCGGCHMLVLARPKQSEDEVDSGHEDEEEDSEVENGGGDQGSASNNHMDILRYSQDLDLTGSFAARDRRRGKQDQSALSSRTLPPLNSTFSVGRALPPLNSLSASKENPFNRSMLPPVSKQESEDLESKPLQHSRIDSHQALLKNGMKKKSKDESEDSDEESEESEDENKPAPKARPVPALRTKSSVNKMAKKPLESESSEEDSEEDKEKSVNGLKAKAGKKLPEKGVRISKEKSESEDSEEESEEEPKKVPKKRIGFFGKRRDSEEEKAEEDAKSKNKGKGAKKGQKANQKKKGKNGEDTVDGKSSESESAEKDEEKGAGDQDKEQKSKDGKEVKPEEKKKSKLCTVL